MHIRKIIILCEMQLRSIISPSSTLSDLSILLSERFTVAKQDIPIIESIGKAYREVTSSENYAPEAGIFLSYSYHELDFLTEARRNLFLQFIEARESWYLNGKGDQSLQDMRVRSIMEPSGSPPIDQKVFCTVRNAADHFLHVYNECYQAVPPMNEAFHAFQTAIFPIAHKFEAASNVILKNI
jgi:hypothetical protein